MSTINFQDFRDRINRTKAGAGHKPEAHQPVLRKAPERREYPIDALLGLRPMVEAIQYRAQAPLELVANAALGTTALASQGLFNVQAKPLDLPLALSLIGIGPPGIRKSTVDRLMKRPIERIQTERRQRQDNAQFTIENKREAYRAARKYIKEDKRYKGKPEAMQAELDKLGPEPKLPPDPQILFGNINAPTMLQRIGPRHSIGVFTAEGGIFFGTTSWQKDTMKQTLATLNELWDGQVSNVDRKVAQSIALHGPRRCTLQIMLQPQVFAELLNNSLLLNTGVLSRWLCVYPATNFGSRLIETELSAEQSQAISVFYQNIECLLREEPRIVNNELELTTIPLTAEAKAGLIDIHGIIETGLAPGGWLADIADFGSKSAEHICRLAGVLAAYEWQAGRPGDYNYPRQPIIDQRIIEAAATLGGYYADEQDRIRMEMALQTDEDEQLAERLLAWLKQHCESKGRKQFFLAEVYQNGPSRKLRKAADTRRILAILTDHVFIKSLQAGVEIDGRDRDEAWELV